MPPRGIKHRNILNHNQVQKGRAAHRAEYDQALFMADFVADEARLPADHAEDPYRTQGACNDQFGNADIFSKRGYMSCND